MADDQTTVDELKAPIRAFAAARGWEPYHTPKNLVMALASEVGELCDLFRWLTPEESLAAGLNPVLRELVQDELADVTNIVMLLSLHLQVDLADAVANKMRKNAVKYPAPPPK